MDRACQVDVPTNLTAMPDFARISCDRSCELFSFAFVWLLVKEVADKLIMLRLLRVCHFLLVPFLGQFRLCAQRATILGPGRAARRILIALILHLFFEESTERTIDISFRVDLAILVLVDL